MAYHSSALHANTIKAIYARRMMEGWMQYHRIFNDFPVFCLAVFPMACYKSECFAQNKNAQCSYTQQRQKDVLFDVFLSGNADLKCSFPVRAV